MAEKQLVLVTGATGYIGGRLVPLLLKAGYPVRCLARDPARISGRAWAGQVQIVAGDALDVESLAAALAGVSTVYYLIHSMKAGVDYHRRDLLAAANFTRAARAAGVRRFIYVGGLSDPDAILSDHLRSRLNTGDVLRESGIQVFELRAAMIVGSGSLSFEILRYLTERLPIILCPPLVDTRSQPIAINDMLAYLIAALEIPAAKNQIIEVGGPDILTYREMMAAYAEARGLRRIFIKIPIPTPFLFTNWIFFDTPIPAAIARPLIESLKNENLVKSTVARQLFPTIQPIGYRLSLREALDQLQAGNVETTWSDSFAISQDDRPPVFMETHEGMIMEHRQLKIDAPREAIFQTCIGLGGGRGWLYMDWAWRIRGVLDLILGGVGLRRGRRNPDALRIGDALDFWRVEALEPNSLLRLRAEMKVPGRAWLQFEIHPLPDGCSTLKQTAYFAPRGLFGFLYWYLLYPIHSLIFSGMIQKIAEKASRLKGGEVN
jgi:uncharacterized protein YbjT (DUF2867 family)